MPRGMYPRKKRIKIVEGSTPAVHTKANGAGRHITRIQKLFPKVQRVVDASTDVTVEVTRADQQRSNMKDPMGCAMARSCKRTFHLDGVIISLAKAYLIKGDLATRYNVPTSLAREVVSFDRNKTFEPGTYNLCHIAPSERLGRSYPSPHKAKGKPTGTRGLRHATTNVRKFPDRAVYEGEADNV
jgi:hypothetical protein